MLKQIFVVLCIALAAPARAFAPARPLDVSKVHMQSKLFAEQLKDDAKPLSVEGDGTSEEEKIEAALAEFKQQSQIKAVAVLGVAFSAFVYLKLQYDADPTTFVGGH